MIPRLIREKVQEAITRQPAVAIIGPRQIGKTTLALEIAKDRPSLYLDLESRVDRAKLADAQFFLQQYEDSLVILDEIHRMPELFQSLRGLIDQGRRKGLRNGRFLILGSASIELLRQSGESLAGRIEYVDMGAINVLEIDEDQQQQTRLWLRGGFPDSFLAKTERDSLSLRNSFIRTYLERDVAQFGPRIPAQTLDRLWTMLAHNDGGLLNASKLAAGLSLSAPTTTAYIDLLCNLLLVRRLPTHHSNVGKRIVKSPKVYVRDSGILHALLNIGNHNELLGHPVVGASWEGFVIENLLSCVPERTSASFYRTAAGAEVDLILELPGKREIWAVEIKLGLMPQPSKGFHNACEDLNPTRAFIVHGGEETYSLGKNFEAISLHKLAEILRQR